MTRSIFDVADELLENVWVGGFGNAFNSVRLADVEDPDEETPTVLVIVAKGEHAALLNRGYNEAMAMTVDLARRIERDA